ncbi:MAG: triose-phosphate isomerase [Bacteroidia bacterium]
MRKKIAAGNWKMHLDAKGAQSLTREVIDMYQTEYQGTAEVVFAPSFPFLPLVHHLIKDVKGVHLAGQNLYQEVQGAYTGEVSAAMLASVGAGFVIIGHSERRQYFGEENSLLARKIDQALAHGLRPIYCIGESLAQREAGRTLDVNRTQLANGAFHLDAAAFGQVVIAYEPIWAIGTGVTATPEQAQEVHAFIRAQIAAQYGEAVAGDTTILYGGSVKADNAKELFAQHDIDGGLVGGASLKSREFVEIIKAL